MLQPNEISKYQSELEQERRRVMAEIANEKPDDFGSDVESTFDEEADQAEDLSNKLAMQGAMKERLNEIDLALNRIKIGAFGKCENCGAEIEKEVLDLVPESVLCQKCKLEKDSASGESA